jgi:hypothetical protein
MELFFLIGALIVFDVLALAFGKDSRPLRGIDDHWGAWTGLV